jgi:hypothetical protein
MLGSCRVGRTKGLTPSLKVGFQDVIPHRYRKPSDPLERSIGCRRKRDSAFCLLLQNRQRSGHVERLMENRTVT